MTAKWVSKIRTLIKYIPIWVFLFSPIAQGEVFRNAYLSFELPPNWKCGLEGTEWVCISSFSKRSKEAIIILTAKEVGPNDTLDNYMGHLKSVKNLQSKSGKTMQSKIYYSKQRIINNHPWIDGHHANSEVENYYTRYLATVKDRIAVLVTFSAHRQHYTKYSKDFIRAIQSLRVIPPKMDLAGGKYGKRGAGAGSLGGPMANPLIPDLPDQFPNEDVGGFSDTEVNIAATALLLAAVGFYLLRLKKKKKKKRG